MDVMRFGKIERNGEGQLSITGFTFMGGLNEQANDPNYVIPAIIRTFATVFPDTVPAETFSESSELIVMRAIAKAREAK